MLKSLTKRLTAATAETLSERKLRLFLCGCARFVWPLLTDKRCTEAVEAAEKMADGSSNSDAMILAIADAANAQYECWERLDGPHKSVSDREEWTAMLWAYITVLPNIPPDIANYYTHNVESLKTAVPQAVQADLLRCIVGNPHRPIELPDHILIWQDGMIPKMAESIYQARSFDQLPILADAMIDAGVPDSECPTCEGCGQVSQEHPWGSTYVVEWLTCHGCGGLKRIPHPLVAHLHYGEAHCRGCHVIDLLTGRS